MTPEQIKSQLKDTSRIVEETLRTVASNISDIFENALSEADSISKVFSKELDKGLKSLARNTDKMIENQVKIKNGLISSSDIQKQIVDYETKREVLSKRIENLMINQPKLAKKLQKELRDVDAVNQDYIKGLKEQEKQLQNIEKKLGLMGKLTSGISKIPIIGNLIDAKKVENIMRMEAAKEGSTKLSILGAGIKAFGKEALDAVKDPVAVITFFIKNAFKADKQIVELQKSLVKTRSEAQGIRESFINMSNSTGDAFINTNKLLEANAKLGQQLGFNKVFSQDMNVEFINLVDKMGIAEDSVGGLAKMSLATGKSMKSIKEQSLGAAQAVSAQVGVQLDNRKILEATGKISGQLLANFQANPAAIAKAVAQAQALGNSLEEVKQQGEALLNFESSIESELKAELLLGKSLNLERARAAALMGDQETVMKELNSQGVDWDKFSKMNVIAQKAYAEALGLSADKLSDQLLQQKYINASKSEVIALEGEAVAKRLESLTAQQKFNAAIEKLQTLIANLVDGPLGTMLNIVSDISGWLSEIVAFFEQSTIGKIIVRGLIGMGTGAAIGGPWGAAIGLAGGITSGVFSPSSMNDGIMDPNGKVLYSGAEGAISLNKNDTVIAGTNLMNSNSNSTSIDLTPMVQAINEVKNAVNKLYSKDSNVYLDGKLVGNTLYQGTYKVI